MEHFLRHSNSSFEISLVAKTCVHCMPYPQSISTDRTICSRSHLFSFSLVALQPFLPRAVALLRAMPGVRNPDGTWLTSERDPDHQGALFLKWQVLIARPYDKSMLGPTWSDFVPEIQRGLEEAFVTNQREFRYDGRKDYYIVDFLTAKQINPKTGTQHDVRRLWVSFPSRPPRIQQYVPQPPKAKGDGKSGKKP